MEKTLGWRRGSEEKGRIPPRPLLRSGIKVFSLPPIKADSNLQPNVPDKRQEGPGER